MSGKINIKKWKMVGIDTNVFIYYYYDNPEFVSPAGQVFYLLFQNQIKAVTSLITMVELLAFRAPEKELEKIKSAFETTPGLNILAVGQEIALEAARIRREYGFRLPDAIQLATALSAKAKAFITNDYRLKAFKKLKIISLSDLA